VGRRGLPVLEELPGDKRKRVLKLWLSCEHLSDIAQEGDLGSLNRNPLHHPDLEELRPKEHNIRVLGSGTVVRAAGERALAIIYRHQCMALAIETWCLFPRM
jgi:hypothetical protein